MRIGISVLLALTERQRGEDYDSSDIGDGIKIGPDLHNGVTDSPSLSTGGSNLPYTSQAGRCVVFLIHWSIL